MGQAQTATVNLSFPVLDCTIFDHLPFVEVTGVLECSPALLQISFPDTESNRQVVADTYSQYETTDPQMLAWKQRKY